MPTSLLLKFLPWGVGAIGICAAVLMYGSQREAQGRADAYRKQAEQLTVEVKRDSVAVAKREASRTDSLARLSTALRAAQVDNSKHAAKTDMATATLRAELSAEQQPKLDALVAAFAVERAGWVATQANFEAQLRLKDAAIEDRDLRIAGLQRLNTSLQEAVKAQPHGGIGHAVTYVLGAAGVVGVLVATHVIK